MIFRRSMRLNDLLPVRLWTDEKEENVKWKFTEDFEVGRALTQELIVSLWCEELLNTIEVESEG